MMVPRRWFVAGSVGAGLLAVLLLGSRLTRPESPGPRSTGTAIGQQAPAFEATTTAGAVLRSKELRGQIVVLTSAAAWCQTCALEAQRLAVVYAEERAGGVTFLTVDIDPQDTPTAIDAFRTRNRTPWAYAPASGAAQLIRDFGMSRFEMTYVIDRRGFVRYRDAEITSADVLKTAIEGLL